MVDETVRYQSHTFCSDIWTELQGREWSRLADSTWSVLWMWFEEMHRKHLRKTSAKNICEKSLRNSHEIAAVAARISARHPPATRRGRGDPSGARDRPGVPRWDLDILMGMKSFSIGRRWRRGFNLI